MSSCGAVSTELRKMNIYVETPGGDTIPIDVSEDADVRHLKHAIFEAEKAQTWRQRLVYQRAILADNRSLASYGITDGVELRLHVQLEIYVVIATGKTITLEQRHT